METTRRKRKHKPDARLKDVFGVILADSVEESSDEDDGTFDDHDSVFHLAVVNALPIKSCKSWKSSRPYVLVQNVTDLRRHLEAVI
jgi:hypothetical protein